MRDAGLLEAKDLVRRYSMRQGLLGRITEVTAVAGVSLALERGRTLGLVGESGCGKSTTGRMVLGLEVPDAGGVSFQGKPMPKPGTPAWRAMRARMQMVFQDPLGALDRRMTIAEQIAEPLVIHAIGNASERAARVESLLRDVGLRADQGSRYPHELSGGQRQRVVLARALATEPALLVCDEPISALDISIQAQVMNLLVELQAARGMAILFISHDLRAVRQVSDRVAVMYLGTIVEEGSPDALLHDPRHPYTRALVSAIPHPGKQGERIVLQGDPPNPAARPTGCAFHPRCPLASVQCRSETPTLRDDGADRRVACHHPHASPIAEAA